jgi:hypothetical protein
VEGEFQPGVFVDDFRDGFSKGHFGPLLQGQPQNMFGGSFHSSPVRAISALVILKAKVARHEKNLIPLSLLKLGPQRVPI